MSDKEKGAERNDKYMARFKNKNSRNNSAGRKEGFKPSNRNENGKMLKSEKGRR